MESIKGGEKKLKSLFLLEMKKGGPPSTCGLGRCRPPYKDPFPCDLRVSVAKYILS